MRKTSAFPFFILAKWSYGYKVAGWGVRCMPYDGMPDETVRRVRDQVFRSLNPTAP